MGRIPCWALVGLLSLFCRVDGDRLASISDVSLRLPTENSVGADASDIVPVTKLVSANPGCFEWESTDHSVVGISLEGTEGCPEGQASSVKLSSLKNDLGDYACEVFAQRDNGISLSLDVYVAPIVRLEIMTTVRRLALFEAETLSVLAYDAKGNVFSSLDGLNFFWRSDWANSGGSGDQVPLKIRRIRESEVMEDRGLEQEYYARYGYKIEVIGNVIGEGRIYAELRHAGLKKDEKGVSAEVVIDVVEPLLICPGAPVLMSGSRIQAEAYRKVTRSSFAAISSHETKYEWLSDDSNILSVSSGFGNFEGKNVGQTRLTLRNREYTINAQSGIANVVDVDGLKLWLAPVEEEDRWSKERLASLNCVTDPFSKFPLDLRLPHRRSWISMRQERWVLTLGKRYFLMATLSSPQLEKDSKSVFVTEEMKFAFQEDALAYDEDSTGGGEITFLTEGPVRVDGGLPFQSVDDVPKNVRVVEASRVGFVDLTSDFFHSSGAAEFHVEKHRVQITGPIILKLPVIRLPVDVIGGVLHSFKIEASGGTEFFFYRVQDDKNFGVHDEHQGIVRMRDQTEDEFSVLVQDKFDHSNSALAKVLVSKPSSLRFEKEDYYVTNEDRLTLWVYMLDKDRKKYSNCTGLQGSVEWEIANSDILVKQGQPKSFSDPSLCAWGRFQAKRPGVTAVYAKFGGNTVRATVHILDKVRIVYPLPNAELDDKGSPVALVPVGCKAKFEVTGGQKMDEFRVRGVGIETPEDIELSPISASGPDQRAYTVQCSHPGRYEVLIQRHARLVVICAVPQAASLSVDGSLEECAPDPVYIANGQVANVRLNLMDGNGARFTDVCFDSTWSLSPSSSELGFEQEEEGTERTLRLGSGFVGNAEIQVSIASFTAQLSLEITKDIQPDPVKLFPIVANFEAMSRLKVLYGPDALLDDLECGIQSPGLVTLHGRTISIHRNGTSDDYESGNLECSMRCLLGSSGFTALVQFQPVANIRIEGPVKMRLNDTVEVVVRIYDRTGRAFSGEMHDFVPVSMNVSPTSAFSLPASTGPARCSATSSSKDMNRCEGEWLVPVEALVPGNALIKAVLPNGIQADHKIRVYRGIEIVQGMKKTVEPSAEFRLGRVYGPFASPAHCRFESDSANVKITDEPKGVFYASSEGRAVVRTVCREGGKVIDQAEIEINVMFLSEIGINPVDLVQMIEGDEIRVGVLFPEIGPEEDVDFDAFNRHFKWSSNDPTVAFVRGPKSDKEVAVWVRGAQPGLTEFCVESHGVAGTPRGMKHLKACRQINVVTRLKLETPATVLIPPHGEFAIKTNLDSLPASALYFSVSPRGCDQASGSGAIQVRPDGLLVAGETPGLANVLVEYRSRGVEGSSLNEGIVQQIIVNVFVQEVAFVGLVELWPSIVLPAGVEQELSVGLFNMDGHRFTSPFSTYALDVRIGNDEVANIKLGKVNGDGLQTLLVSGRTEGTTVVSMKASSSIERNPITEGYGSVAYGDIREDYFRVVIIPASHDVHFDVERTIASSSTGKLLLVSWDTVRVPITSSAAIVKDDIGCVAHSGAHEFSTKIVDDDTGTWCAIALGSLPDFLDDFLGLDLIVDNQNIESVSIPSSRGFHILSEFSTKPLRGRHPVIKWTTNGTADAETMKVFITGSDTHLISVDSTRPSLIGLNRVSNDCVSLIKLSNETCNVGPISVIFSHPGTQQRTEMGISFRCPGFEGHSQWLQSVNVLGTVLGTFAVILLLHFCCSSSGGSRFILSRSPGPQHVSFNDMDRRGLYPQLLREQHLGSPGFSPGGVSSSRRRR